MGLTLLLVDWLPGLGIGQALGAFAGAGTSTAALQAAIAAFGTDPATGYSVAYPLGVAVPILLLGLYNALRKPAIDAGAASALHVEEIDVDEFSVLGMTLVAARDLSPLGIRVVTIAPGTINTPAYGKAGDQLEQYWGPQVPFPKRLGRPEEYASLAVFMIESGYMNAESVRLDGGIRMAPR